MSHVKFNKLPYIPLPFYDPFMMVIDHVACQIQEIVFFPPITNATGVDPFVVPCPMSILGNIPCSVTYIYAHVVKLHVAACFQ